MTFRPLAPALRSFLAAAALLAPNAHAGDWWVDAVHGDDSNGGTSETDAWRTITHALTQLGPTPGVDLDVVHLLPGEYRATKGEVFPLTLRDQVRLVGEQGPDLTLVFGNIRVGVGDDPTSEETGAEGLSLIDTQDLTSGIMQVSKGPLFPVRRSTFRDLRIVDFHQGVYVYAKDAKSKGSSLSLEDATIESCLNPFRAETFKGTKLALELRGVAISDFYSSTLTAKNGATLDFLFERSTMRVTGFQFTGLNAYGTIQGGQVRTTFRDSEITSFCLSTVGLQLNAEVLIERCTITGHDVGVRLNTHQPVMIRDSILWGNDEEDLQLATGTTATVENCVIDDPVFTGANGNFSADPFFHDPSRLDYRLRFGSPAVDQLPASHDADLVGTPRFLDGDLDTSTGRDIGAREQRLLEAPAQAAVGDTVTFQLQGPTDGTAWLHMSREAPLTAPLLTVFGQQWLAPDTFIQVATVALDSPLGTDVDVALPVDPALVGATLGFQALVRAPLAPTGLAWSEPVAISLH